MKRIVVDEARIDVGLLNEAVQEIRRGGVIAMPTDTLYGLAVDPFRAEAVERLFAVKGRDASSALPLVAADLEQVRMWIGALPPLAARLAARFWPGPLTLLLAAPDTLAPAVSAGTNLVGVRVPAHPVTRALCRACGRPLTATSANVSGAAPSASPDDVARTIGDRIDVLIDAGQAPGGPPSTIVNAAGETPVLIRAGAISWEAIRA